MKKTDDTPEIELEEIKTILQQLQSMQVPNKASQPQKNGNNLHEKAAETSSAKKTVEQHKPFSPETRSQQRPPAQQTVDKNHSGLVITLVLVVGVVGAGAYLGYVNGALIRETFESKSTVDIKTAAVSKPASRKVEIQEQSPVQKPEITVRSNETVFDTIKLKPEVKLKPESQPEYKIPKRNPNLLSAEKIMKEGKILKAREILIREAGKISDQTSIDAENIYFKLAQSYDPNFLASLNFADADADLVEAKKWYEKWYETAEKKGIVSDRSSLDNILKKL